MTLNFKTTSRLHQINLPINFMNRFMNASFLFLTCLIGAQSVNAADLLNNVQSEPSIQSLHQDAMNVSTRRKNNNCFPCVGPRGDCGCPGTRGNPGVSGLAEIAAYESVATVAALSTTYTANNPIPFVTRTVSTGTAVQSASPFTTFTLAPGDYQIDCGVSTGGTPPSTDFQLLVYLNDEVVFAWPAAPLTPVLNPVPNFVEFSVILNADKSSNTLEIRPSVTTTPTANAAGTTFAFINFLKLDRADNNVGESCESDY